MTVARGPGVGIELHPDLHVGGQSVELGEHPDDAAVAGAVLVAVTAPPDAHLTELVLRPVER